MAGPWGLWGRQGSADETDYPIGGWEWLRLFRYSTHKVLLCAAIIVQLATSCSDYFIAICQGNLADILTARDFNTADDFTAAVNGVTLMTMLIIAMHFVLVFGSGMLEGRAYPGLVRDLRMATMRCLMAQDIGFFDAHHTGVLLTRLSEDCPVAHDAWGMRMPMLLRVAVQTTVGWVICLWKCWEVALMALVTFPVYALAHRLSARWVDREFVRYNERSTRVTVKGEEVLQGFRTVRTHDAELREYGQYKRRLESVHEVVVRAGRIVGVKDLVTTLVHWGMASSVMYFAGTRAASGRADPGAVVTLLQILWQWEWAFAGIFNSLQELKKSNVSSAKLLEILERAPQIELGVGGRLPLPVAGKVEFRDVRFQYPNRDELALDGLSLTVAAGETVAIVGESGCGKSTALALLQRFYDALPGGAILIDDVDIRRVAPHALRTHIAMVQQTPVVFSMTVKENIRYGRPAAGREEVVRAARAAAAHGFIAELRSGYSTQVGPNTLSGGQKQRICIARALLLQAPLLILDEATAALDTESEQLVQDALTTFRRGRTAILVAHRLATVRHADRIIVLEKGRVVETGTHDELLDREGTYARLIRHQLQ